MTDENVEVSDQYYLVVCPDTGTPLVEPFSTLEELAARLTALKDSDVTVMLFCGRRLYVSQGDMKYLFDDGHAEPVPLFTVPQPGENAVWESVVRFGAEASAQGIALGTPADVTGTEEVAEEPEEEEEED
jgi:hypothetical protein